jgi:small multidrug resistance family-3 protein
MAIAWGWTFEGIVPDVFDVVGAVIAIIGVLVIFYMPRKDAGEKSIWSRQQ